MRKQVRRAGWTAGGFDAAWTGLELELESSERVGVVVV